MRHLLVILVLGVAGGLGWRYGLTARERRGARQFLRRNLWLPALVVVGVALLAAAYYSSSIKLL